MKIYIAIIERVSGQYVYTSLTKAGLNEKVAAHCLRQ